MLALDNASDNFLLITASKMKFANYKSAGINSNCVSLFSTFSIMTWQSTSICFQCSWKTGLVATCHAYMLSEYNTIEPLHIKPISYTRIHDHKYSHVQCIIAWYSTSTLDGATSAYFCFSKNQSFHQQVYNIL